MLEESGDLVGEEEVGGGRDEDLTDLGERNTATAGVAGATSCVPNDWSYGLQIFVRRYGACISSSAPTVL